MKSLGLLRNSTRAFRALTEVAQKTTHSVSKVFGVEEQVDSLVNPVVDLVDQVADAFEPEPLYKEKSGPCEVGTHRESMVDPRRGRKIPLTVYYPKGQTEKSPVVVLSPGLGGNGATYRYLGRHMASHGYTVLQPTHKGSDTAAVLLKTPLFAFTQEELLQRKADVSYCLDRLESGDLPEEVTELADMDKVGMVGHSFGALTAQAIAGAVVRDESGAELDLSDERIDAFVAMSPYGDSTPSRILGMDTTSYDQIEQPIMYMAGTTEKLFTLGEGSEVHLDPFLGTASEHKYHLSVDTANHLDFAQVLGFLDSNTADITKSTSVAFLDAHLKQDSQAQEYLSEDLPRLAETRQSRLMD